MLGPRGAQVADNGVLRYPVDNGLPAAIEVKKKKKNRPTVGEMNN